MCYCQPICPFDQTDSNLAWLLCSWSNLSPALPNASVAAAFPWLTAAHLQKGCSPMPTWLKKYHILSIFMAEVEQLNYKGIGTGHSWKTGMLPDTKRWVLLLKMQRNHSNWLMWWWILLYHTHTLQPKTPAWNRNWNSKTPSKHLCASLHLHIPTRARIRKCLIARENPVLVCYFPPSGIRAIAPRSAVNQWLIYHPLLNVSSCPMRSVKGTGILKGKSISSL